MFNFHRKSRQRKYFNDENFTIYGICCQQCRAWTHETMHAYLSMTSRPVQWIIDPTKAEDDQDRLASQPASWWYDVLSRVSTFLSYSSCTSCTPLPPDQSISLGAHSWGHLILYIFISLIIVDDARGWIILAIDGVSAATTFGDITDRATITIHYWYYKDMNINNSNIECVSRTVYWKHCTACTLHVFYVCYSIQLPQIYIKKE